MTPRFSIVIPTRNRAGLLRHALATAVAQTHDDIEIVVSDNASSDDTRDVAHAIGDPRLRYVRSDTPLNNADSWEFAVSHATGEWVTVLGDDDGLVPTALERVDLIGDERPIIAWLPAWYVHPDAEPPWPEPAEQNRLSVHPFTGSSRTVGAAEQLSGFFARREIDPIPTVVNGAVRRSCLDELRERTGRVFGEPDPSWALAAGLMVVASSYAVVDLPLSVAGVSEVNIGGGFLRNTRGHGTIREFDHEGLFEHVPLASRTCTNLVAESLVRMKRALPDGLAGYDLDLPRYFVAVRQELEDPRRRTGDGLAVEEWERVLAAQSAPVRWAVRRQLWWHRVTAGLRGAARDFEAIRAVRRVARGVAHGETPFRVWDGDESGFSDLPGAARHLDMQVLPALASATDVA